MRRLNLLRFAPFRFNRLATELSNAIAQDYARFGIDIPEWRVMATLGMHEGPKSANYVVRCTRTHKSRISRAVSHLVELGYLERREDEADRREIMLQLSPRGRDVYDELVPMLTERERQLLSGLDADEQRQLDALLAKLEASLHLVNGDG
jgi:DNA-binding MarR family transcriptional regulator